MVPRWSRLVTGKRFFAHYGLATDKARTFDAEAYDGGIVGFKLIEESGEGQDDSETPAPAKKAPTKSTGRKAKARAAS